MKETSNRLNWIDWMKAIGISLIVYGHFFSVGADFVYVFSVPLFFVISGFLCKPEHNNKVFWKKLFGNLIVPMFIICTLNYGIEGIKGYYFSETPVSPNNPLVFLFKLVAGYHHGGVGMFWFVYVLVILKILLQYTRSAVIHIFMLLFFLVGAYLINDVYHDSIPLTKMSPLASVTVLVCFPFFICGYYLRRIKQVLVEFDSILWLLLIAAVCLVIISFCGIENERVLMYKYSYGSNIFLFLLGGFAGTAFTFVVSKMLDKVRSKTIEIISLGTIIILGLHDHIIWVISKYLVPVRTSYDILFSVLIVLLFVPIVIFLKQFFPIVLGSYRVRKEHDS